MSIGRNLWFWGMVWINIRFWRGIWGWIETWFWGRVWSWILCGFGRRSKLNLSWIWRNKSTWFWRRGWIFLRWFLKGWGWFLESWWSLCWILSCRFLRGSKLILRRLEIIYLFSNDLWEYF